jgi:deoxyribose-phosphate aldolase
MSHNHLPFQGDLNTMGLPEPILAKTIDHALLHPTLTDAEMSSGCEIARRLHVASVCVKPSFVTQATQLLAGSDVRVGTVIGFPHGVNTTAIKALEAEQACQDGAVELDMVVNVGKVLSGDWQYVQADIAAVLKAARKYQAILKVIFETDYLKQDADKIQLCKLCDELGVDFVKTSTGFGFVKQASGGYDYVGATAHDVALMRANCSSRIQVKASGGIRTREEALRMVRLGATRLGTSASDAILHGEPTQQEGY